MSWIDRLLRRSPKTSKFAPTLDGFSPIFSQFGTDIYASDVVQQALGCIVREMKKLKPTHIRVTNNDPVPVVNSDLQKVLNNPNPLMTTSDFIEKIMWLLLMNYNAFIIPVYDVITRQDGGQRRVYKALYPIKPIQVDFIEDASGKLFVKFFFTNNYETTIPYEDVIHIRQNYSVNEYMGGNEFGQPDHGPLLETLKLNDMLLKGVAKAMNASYAVNGVVRYNTLMDDGKTEQKIHELEQHLLKSESGILATDLKTDFTPIMKNVALVDENTLKFVDEKILRNFGVPLAILTGDYSKIQYSSFYQSTLEPLIINISQAFTKKLFTDRQMGAGNKIEFYPEDLVFMTVNQVLHMVQLLSNTGALTENEKRVAFGLRPLPELEGKRYMSLNWIDSSIAQQYQFADENEAVEGEGGENQNDEAGERDGGVDDGDAKSEMEYEDDDDNSERTE